MSNLDFILMQDVIAHSRTKGSKNGERRYQNEDGSLTPLGVEHQREMRRERTGYYDNRKQGSKDSSKDAKKKESNPGKDLGEAAKNLMKAGDELPTKKGKYMHRDYTKLSNQDLEKRIRRLELEDRYGQLSGDSKYVKSGSEKVADVLKYLGSALAVVASGVIIAKTVQDISIAKEERKRQN